MSEDFRYFHLTCCGRGVGYSQHTRQASVRKDMLNTGGFFLPAEERSVA